MKLACIQEIFGLPDCAAELLQMKRDVVGDDVDVQGGLNVLTQEMDPASTSFREYNQKFQASPKAFYPPAAAQGLAPSRRLLSALATQIRRLAGGG